MTDDQMTDHQIPPDQWPVELYSSMNGVTPVNVHMVEIVIHNGSFRQCYKPRIARVVIRSDVTMREWFDDYTGRVRS